MPTRISFAGQTQNTLLHVLMRSSEALPLDDIAAQLGITKTAARQHILGLQQEGYVQIQDSDPLQKKQRGRPNFSYELTEEGQELFARQYALFSNRMIGIVRDLVSSKDFKKIMKNMGISLAADLAHNMPKPQRGKTPSKETLTTLSDLLRDLGYDTYLTDNDEITAHNCVYHQVARDCKEVCEVDLSLMQKLTGKKPTLKECIVRGGRTCKFKF